MTLEQTRKIADAEERRCQACERYRCQICSLCDHNAFFVAHVPFKEKLKGMQDEVLDDYR